MSEETKAAADGSLGDALRALAEPWRYTSGAHGFYGAGIGYRDAADMADARDQKLLDLAADLRAEADEACKITYLVADNLPIVKRDAADRIEAALRGGGGSGEGQDVS